MGIPLSLIERILCPVDPEWAAQSALKYSFALAERFHASIDVVHAWSPPPPQLSDSNGPRPDGAVLEQQLRARLERTMSTIPTAIPGRATTRIIEGPPRVALLSHSRRSRCDLIVLGSGRLHPDTSAGPPGVGEAVAHHADCAVLTLREAEPLSSPFSIRRILLAVDFSDATAQAIDWTAALARGFGASLQLLHVRDSGRPGAPRPDVESLGLRDDDAREMLSQIEHRFTGRGVQVELAALSEGGVADCLLERTSASACDLIVLGAHARPGAVENAIRGVVADVRRRSRVPVLSVRKSRPEALFR